MPAISVLMCAYNVKDYVGYAIESVLNQTFTDFELIIINDGSNDGTVNIIEEYSKKDNRIKVHHIENGGLANARNVALTYATGEYIAWIDADDAFNKDYLEILYKAALDNKSDVVICNYYRYVDKDRVYCWDVKDENDTLKLSWDDVYKRRYEQGYIIYIVVWAKLVKRSLYKDIYYPKG